MGDRDLWSPILRERGVPLDEQIEIQQALALLDANARQILKLLYWDGMTAEAAGALLGVSMLQAEAERTSERQKVR